MRTDANELVKASSASPADADDILDSLAWAAYLDQAAEERGWPSREGTRRRAFDYFEQALREKNAAKRPAQQSLPRTGCGERGLTLPPAPNPPPRSAR